tara:strand:- start:111 stop:482 length:372 start_codon:yes stop_codon:yes gene_type:complete
MTNSHKNYLLDTETVPEADTKNVDAKTIHRQKIRDNFGMDSVRVAANHSKFALIKAGEWRLVLFTSMNLNYNPRFENFQIRHDPQLFKFHADILDTLWKKQSKKAALDSPHSLQIKFENDTWQ